MNWCALLVDFFRVIIFVHSVASSGERDIFIFLIARVAFDLIDEIDEIIICFADDEFECFIEFYL